MGVIQRQTLKNTFLSGIGIAVGLYSNIKIYPLDLELKGLAEAIIKAAMLLGPPVLLGLPSVMVRFRPYVRGPNGAGLLFGRSLLLVTAALLVTGGLLLLLGDPLLAWLRASGLPLVMLEDYRWPILGILAATTYATIFSSHALNAHRIAVPVLFRDLTVKLGLPLLVLLTVYGHLSAEGFVMGLVGMFWVGALGLLGYIYIADLGKPEFRNFTFDGVTRREVYDLAAFSLLGTLGSQMTIVVDTLSINWLLGNFDTAVYSFALFVCTVILVPYRAVDTIARPIIAQAWKDNEVSKISYLYRETAMVLYAVGALIYTGSLVCVPYLYELTAAPGDLAAGYTALVILGGAQLFDLMTSVNGVILGFSDYYRWNIYLLLFLGVLMVICNYIFITLLGLGITGAALGTMTSMVLYNLGKVGLLWWKMRILPFSVNMVYTTLLLAAVGTAAYLLPFSAGPVINILIRGGLITLCFLAVVRFTPLLPEVRTLLLKGPKALFR